MPHSGIARRVLWLSVGLWVVIAATPGAAGPPPVLYVDADRPGGDGSSWSEAFTHLQDALSVVAGPAEIWIAEGTYMPNGSRVNDAGFQDVSGGVYDRTATFLVAPGTTIRGGFAGTEAEPDDRAGDHLTILSGAMDNASLFSRRSYNVVRVESAAIGPVILESLVIEKGNSESPASEGDGGGINVRTNVLLDLRDVIVQQCQAQMRGAGVWSAGRVIIKRSRFEENESGAGGGAINVRRDLSEGSHLVVQCEFISNDAGQNGGAILVSGIPEGPVLMQVQNSLFHDCSAIQFGGAVSGNPGTEVRLHNCLLLNNEAGVGGAVSVTGPDTRGRVHNCTFSSNNAIMGGMGGDLHIGSGNELRVFNSLFAYDSAEPTTLAEIGGGGILAFRDCMTDNPAPFAGGATLDGTPEYQSQLSFIDVDGADDIRGTLDDDLRLSPDSPAIDRGHNYWYLDEAYSDETQTTDNGRDLLDLNGNGSTDREYLPIDLQQGLRFLDVDTVPDAVVCTAVDDTVPVGDGVDTEFGGILPCIDLGCYEVQSCMDCPGSRRWLNVAGGNFEDAFNWFPALPGDLNIAAIGQSGAGAYTIQLNSSRENLALSVEDNDVTIDLGQNIYLLNAVVEPSVNVTGTSVPGPHLFVTNGMLAGESLLIGELPKSRGSVTIDGAQTLLDFNRNLSVGVFGEASMEICDGASVFALTVGVGEQAGSSGDLVVSDGSELLTTDVQIAEGSLAVQGTGVVDATVLPSGDITVLSGGVVRGDGTLVGDVINFGKVEAALGASGIRGTGALTVLGDYYQPGAIPQIDSIGGILQSEVSGGTSTEATRLAVQGDATVAGGLLVRFAEGSPAIDPAELDGLTFLQADAATGRFDVALMPAIAPDAGGNVRFLRVVYPSDPGAARGTGEITLTVETLGVGGPSLGVESTGALSQQPVAAAVGDVGRFTPGGPDGAEDLVVIYPDGTGIVLYNVGGAFDAPGSGTSQFSVGAGTDPTDVAVGDVNDDSLADVVITNRGSDNVAILLNDGDGLFPSFYGVGVGTAPVAVALGDLDGDGRPEILTANEESDDLAVVYNDGGDDSSEWRGATFHPVGQRPSDVALADFDTDKFDDPILSVRGDDRISIFTNSGTGTLGARVDRTVGDGPSRLIVEDLDADGRSDVVTINEGGDAAGILRSNGPGFGDFAPAVEQPLAGTPLSLVAVDLDEDADRDLAIVVDFEGVRSIAYYRNDYFGPTDDLILTDITGDPGLPDVSGPQIVLRSDVDLDAQEDLVVINDGSGARSAHAARGATPERVRVFLPLGCPGDADGSGSVDFTDLNLVLAGWGGPGDGDVFPVPGGDGVINFDDLNAVLAQWGASCN